MFDKTQNMFPSIFGIYILAYSRLIVNRIVECIDGFKQKKVYYTDTDSLYIWKSDFDILDRFGFVGVNIGQGKNE